MVSWPFKGLPGVIPLEFCEWSCQLKYSLKIVQVSSWQLCDMCYQEVSGGIRLNIVHTTKQVILVLLLQKICLHFTVKFANYGKPAGPVTEKKKSWHS